MLKSTSLSLPLYIFLGAMMVVSYFEVATQPAMGDEVMHFEQILMLHQGSHEHSPVITNILGFHYAIAYLGIFIDDLELWQARLIHLLLVSMTLFFIFKIAKHLQDDSGHWRVVEVCFIPIIYPYFFLVYTDILGLLLVLGAFYFTLIKRYFWATIFILLSVCVRQPNIMWAAFLAVYIFIKHNKADFSLKALLHYLKKVWGLILTGILFLVFVYWNDGVAMGDHASHPLDRFRLSNIVFALVVFFIIFLPLHLYNLSKVKRMLLQIPALLFLIMILYIIFYNNAVFTHHFNGIDFFIRNKLLIGVMNNTFVKMIFVFIALYTLLSLAVTPLRSPVLYWFYVFFALSIMPSWLVEQRYYIVGAAFFVLFKKETPELDVFQIAYGFILSFVAWRGIVAGDFLL